MVIRSSDEAHNEEFMARVWPGVDEPLGIAWDEFRGYLRSDDTAGGTQGVANFRVVGGVGELLQILVLPERHRGGVGAELLDAFERECRARLPQAASRNRGIPSAWLL